MQNREIRFMARRQLKGNWGLALGTFLLVQTIISGVYYLGFFIAILCDFILIEIILPFLIAPIFVLGKAKFSLNLATDKNSARIEDIFSQFALFLKGLGLICLEFIIVLLGSIFFIIPGIILSLAYSQSFYILVENPEKSIFDCLKESRVMMIGYKWKLFCLYFSFIGWLLLSILTCGIGSLWLTPYIEISKACFYEDIKTINENSI
ncbi:DUF975 family protein [Clostridium bornimense]|uniref:DUF975 family protein n=1 Tax=Clostridium bornimense TaxID=1216932 RepID=UPI001C0FFE11|nr:DUF975 family protein [Clostridium bornimense]MBU5316717.1 DUF975 family protein [Clostridium bornimense]